MLNCRDATRLMSEAQEHPLAWQEKVALRLHLMMCSGCRNFGRQMHILRNIARACAKGADDEQASPGRTEPDERQP